YLARMPKSGGWLVTVKAFLGFLELMAALKFLSNADLFWNLQILTRPVFLAVWFAIAAVAGLYMLGLVRLPHDSGARVGPVRGAFGVASLAAAIWLLAGINGARLGWLVAFLPPPDYGQRSVAAAEDGLAWTKDYDAAVRQAKAENKLVFLDFTGYQCSNCRVMEQEVFPREEVRAELEKMVRVRLYTDGNDAQSRKYAALQLEKYGQTTLPLYVVISADGTKLGESPFNTDVKGFTQFLRDAQSRGAQLAQGG
ncbi:MAG TPA: thioredoxin family protein, partial [Armatimonadota bacterium]|nr:thioredoxin family protein [Armatimonadota bacterium]